MKCSRFAAVVLAAGFSRRIGRFKPLLPIGDETITDRVISTFSQNDVDVYLVVGWRQKELCARIKAQKVQIVENPNFGRDMLTSVQAGLRSLGSGYEAFFIMPVDIPLVRYFTIKRLIEVAQRQPGKLIYPVFGKIRGHPPLIPTSILPDILGGHKDGGLKAILNAYENIALEVKVPDNNIIFDVDHPEDYKAILARFRHYEVPLEEECEIVLTDVCKVSQGIYNHSLKVAEVAMNIGKALLKAGLMPDLAVIRAAALLHDIAKGQSEHEAIGRRMLYEMGFGKIGDIVAMHMNLAESIQSVPLEAKVVYLADKYVNGASLLSIEERYQSSSHRFGLTPEIEANIMRGKLQALNVKQELETLLGYALEEII